MVLSIQQGFWGVGKTDLTKPPGSGVAGMEYVYGLPVSGVTVPGDASTPIGQLKFYQYRFNRKFDLFRRRQAKGWADNDKIDPSIGDYSEAKFLLGQMVPGHTAAVKCEGTIITLESTWSYGGAGTAGITAASIISGNFDFGPYSRMRGLGGLGDLPPGAVTADINARWACAPAGFKSPWIPAYGTNPGYTGTNTRQGIPPSSNAWQTSFVRDDVRTSLSAIAPGSNSLQTSTKDCYSLYELGLDILYLTTLFPHAVFIMDHILEANISHNGYPTDIPSDLRNSTLLQANYSDAVLHEIAFLEAMGIYNVLHHIGLAGPSFYNGGGAGANSADPWWGNILAQEKGDTAYGTINANYASGNKAAGTVRTWAHLAGRDMYSGQNGTANPAVAYRSPQDIVNGMLAWAHKFSKYCTIWTTGVTYKEDTNSPLTGNQHATYPKNGTLKQSGAPAPNDAWFSVMRLLGDAEMGVAGGPRLFAVVYQNGYESQDSSNAYDYESDSLPTVSGGHAVLSPNPYWDASPGYTPTTLPPLGARKGWRAAWDWMNAANWKGGTPLLLPSAPAASGHTSAPVSGGGRATVGDHKRAHTNVPSHGGGRV